MATVSRRDVVPKGLSRAPPLLASVDRMTQSEFHRRYLEYPADVTFELINGTVYLAPPTILKHGKCTAALEAVLGHYEMETPGVEALLRPTVILGKQSEPQPDLVLYVLPENGGRIWTDDDFLAGAPELVIEVARNPLSIDFHGKKDDYERNRIAEYVIVCLEEERT